ncbi:site-specific integrase (plasmid) [Prescottella equi]|uniref:tyrosine-type recombinase/integrase n=1 Tax=Rhodococcus hoagii TaxID=43767 RepID=UPI00257891BA|nr:site-specific integrase [Prescottella equi]WJJ14516.1 site-specific integrase [Prescottella equi]
MSKDWIATGGVNRSDTIRDCIRSTAMLSDAIAVGPGHDDPTKLSRADISRFVTTLKATELCASRKSKFLYAARQFVTHARRDSWLEGVPRTFDFLPGDTIEGDEADDDDLVGKALPEPIIRQLDQHVGLLRATVHRLPLGKELTTELRLLAYQLLRDTGRRVSDLAALPLEPIVHEGDEYTLVFDNIKARRRGRKLPIDKSTADAIAQVGDMVAATFPNTPRKDLPLFPRPTRNPYGTKRTTGAGLADWMEAWFNRIPPLLDDHLDSDGGMSPFPRERLYCHAFRHSYAQRLADAGTHPDVTRELMDHKSLETTMIYYTVTAKRRREAVDKVAAFRVDRHGNHVGPVSSTNYGRQAVAVPYGNCQEPSNVVAGGKACPIRLQCAGCSYYRPDPSFLPAIETHIAELMTNREEAIAAGSAEWVLDGFDAELAAYRVIAQKMRGDLSALDPEQRAAVDEASAILRKSRAAAAVMADIDERPRTAASPDPVALALLPIGQRPSTSQGEL